MSKRKLKIEELGVSFDAAERVPLVRLKGRWLQAAGFASGRHVEITLVAPGRLQLRLADAELPQ